MEDMAQRQDGFHATQFPGITCSCKRPRCPVIGCWKCSRCGCDCDGVAPAAKRTRTRGRPAREAGRTDAGASASRAPVKTAVGRRTRRSTSRATPLPESGENMSECDEVEIPSPVGRRTAIRQPVSERATTNDDDMNDLGDMNISSPIKGFHHGSGPTTAAGQRVQHLAGMYLSPGIFSPTPEAQKQFDIFAVMEFFRCDEALIKLMKKKIPAKKRRLSRRFWASSASSQYDDPEQSEFGTDSLHGDQPRLARERQERTAALRLVWILLNHICSTLCGAEAAPAFLELFLSWISPPQVSTLTNITTPVRVFVATKRGSVERRCVRALLCDAFPLSVLATTRNQIDGFAFGKNSYTAGRRDLQVLLEEGRIEKPKWSRAKYKEKDLHEAIKCILSMENVAFLSWGTKTINLDGQRHEVPSIQRRKLITVIFDQYRARGGVVPRSTFYRITSVLTHEEVEARCAVDYVTGFLVNDNFRLLERIIRDLLPEAAFDLLPKLAILKEWLKYGSGFDIDSTLPSDCASCPRHQVKFGLSKREKDDKTCRIISCYCCLAMRAVLNDLTQRLAVANVDVTTVGIVRESYKKMELFLGHRMRVRNQQWALRAASDNLRAHCKIDKTSNEAIAILDFKMKFEPMYFREKTVEHYGKRGISWHGSLVRYWTCDENSEEVVETKRYYDQIGNGDNKQDKNATAALVEAFLLSLRRDIPHITHLTFQSDNASNYQNAFLALMLPILGAAHGFSVVRFVHTDTQDGKSMLDAHFATASGKVKSWVRQGNDCATPRAVVEALTANGCLPNCIGELVEIDRSRSTELYQQMCSLEKALATIIDRANDILYHSPLPQTLSAETSFDATECPSFRMLVFEYSGIGDGVAIIVNPSSGQCSIAGDTQSVFSEEIESSSVGSRSLLGQNSLVADEFVSRSPEIDAEGDIQRRLHFDSSDADGGVCQPNAAIECFGDEDESYEECDADLDMSSGNSDESEDENGACMENGELIMPREVVGIVTGVRIKTTAQIRRHARTVCKRTFEQQPSTDKTGIVSEKDVEAFAKLQLLELNIGGDFGDIIARAGLAAKMLTICPSVVLPVSTNATDPPQPGDTAQNDITPTSGPVRDAYTTIDASVLDPVSDRGIPVENEELIDSIDISGTLPSSDEGNITFGESGASSDRRTLKAGWARRPKRGEMYGKKYISLYEKEIEEMFQQGVENQSRKMGPARMLEALVAMYPHRYNLPGENEIRGLITRLMQRRKRNTSSLTQTAVVPVTTMQISSQMNRQQPTTSPPAQQLQTQSVAVLTSTTQNASSINRRQRAINQQLQPAYAEFLEDLVAANPQIKPKTAMIIFYESFPELRETTTERQIRDKVSGLKKKSKKHQSD